MSEEPETDVGAAYMRRRQTIFDFLNEILEQADTLLEKGELNVEDRDELNVGALMLADGIKKFYDCSDAAIVEQQALFPVLFHLSNCLYAVLGGSASSLRHVDLSKSRRKAVFRENTEAASSAKASGKVQEAEKARDIIERAELKPDGTLKKPGGVKRLVAAKLGKQNIDYKTFRAYVAVIDGSRRTNDPPTKK